MHRTLSSVLPIPFTVILPPHAEVPDFPPIPLETLGASFDLKPAHAALAQCSSSPG